MSTTAFDTPSLPQRILPLFRGFDWPLIGLLLAFVLSPFAPLPKGQALARRNETRAAP